MSPTLSTSAHSWDVGKEGPSHGEAHPGCLEGLLLVVVGGGRTSSPHSLTVIAIFMASQGPKVGLDHFLKSERKPRRGGRLSQEVGFEVWPSPSFGAREAGLIWKSEATEMVTLEWSGPSTNPGVPTSRGRLGHTDTHGDTHASTHTSLRPQPPAFRRATCWARAPCPETAHLRPWGPADTSAPTARRVRHRLPHSLSPTSGHLAKPLLHGEDCEK